MGRSRSDAAPSGAACIDSLAQGGSSGYADDASRWGDFSGLPGGSSGPMPADKTRWLSRTIETEIIPRLMLSHRGMEPERLTPGAAPGQPSEKQVNEFAQLAQSNQAAATLAYVRDLRQAGVSLEDVYLHLLAPAARRLGALWEADLCGFTEVTMGLWRLQQVMHELGAAFQDPMRFPVQPRRAILVPVPGSQHTMGLFMVAEFFRRAGWDVWGDAMVTSQEIVKTARNEWFDVMGISVAIESQIGALASVILDVRKASRNRGLLVIIGGPIVTSTPGLAARVGADASADDAPQAVSQAESLLSGRSAAS